MSMRRSVDRIRTTHTGSLPPPPDMLETLHQLAAGHSIDPAAYESALTRHVAEFVRRQVEAGIHTVSDGECSKPSFQHYVAERLAGFEARAPEGGLPVPTGPMGLDGRDALMFPDFYRNVLEHNPFRNTVRMAPARLRRPDPVRWARQIAARHRESENSDGGRGGGRRLYASIGADHGVAERLLRDGRGIYHGL